MNVSKTDTMHESSSCGMDVDLSMVIDRLVLIEKWRKKDALAASEQYRNFIYLIKKHGNMPPSKEVDEFWHAHILHTRDYIIFCEKLFGKYLNHHPPHHNGKNDEGDDLDLLSTEFQTVTQQLYFSEFGEYLYEIRSNPILSDLKKIFEYHIFGE